MIYNYFSHFIGGYNLAAAPRMYTQEFPISQITLGENRSLNPDIGKNILSKFGRFLQITKPCNSSKILSK